MSKIAEEIEVPAEIVPDNAPETKIVALPESISNGLARIEDDLLDKSAKIVDAVQAFAEIDPSDEHPPAEWVEKYGKKAAIERHRLARAGWMSTKEAPIGIKVAHDTMMGIMRVRSQRQVAGSINVAIQKAVLVVTPHQDLPTVDIDE